MAVNAEKDFLIEVDANGSTLKLEENLIDFLDPIVVNRCASRAILKL